MEAQKLSKKDFYKKLLGAAWDLIQIGALVILICEIMQNIAITLACL